MKCVSNEKCGYCKKGQCTKESHIRLCFELENLKPVQANKRLT